MKPKLLKCLTVCNNAINRFVILVHFTIQFDTNFDFPVDLHKNNTNNNIK